MISFSFLGIICKLVIIFESKTLNYDYLCFIKALPILYGRARLT
nr:MAG TPA: hypothetical protein [Caudoviricetes sp.]